MYKILAVILARGGSKGIPRKNIRPINGHPLISYTITAALHSKYIDRLIVSTDDDEIANIALEYGAEVPFKRPAHLAEDHVFSRDALQHAVIEAERIYNTVYDYVVELPCVAPLRDHEDINQALEKLIGTGADSVISVCQVGDKHPVRMKKIVNDQIFDFTSEFPEGEGSRRQDLPPCYIRNGAIYSMKRDTIVKEFSRNGSVSRPFIMDEERSVNIDSMPDFYLAEMMIRQGKTRNRPIPVTSNKIEHYEKSGAKKVLVTLAMHFLPDLKEQLKQAYDVIFAPGVQKEQLELLVADRDAWIVSPVPPYRIDQEIIDKAPHLLFVGSASTGSNHLDLDYLQKKGIVVSYLKGTKVIEDVHASAEFSFALMLAVIKKAVPAMEAARLGVWREAEDAFRGIEAYGKTIGLVGYGRIGKKMARYAHAFGMNVLAHDPHVHIQENHVSQVELDDLLTKSDIVSVHVHLDASTQGMFSETVFSKMKHGAFFINTSRGEIVVEADLIQAMNTGKIAAAGVDVISCESEHEKFNHPLIAYARENPQRLLVSPHMAGLTVDSERKTANYIINEMNATLIRASAT